MASPPFACSPCWCNICGQVEICFAIATSGDHNRMHAGGCMCAWPIREIVCQFAQYLLAPDVEACVRAIPHTHV